MKSTFCPYSKSDFRQPKFHMTLHHVDVIRRFGSVRYADAGPGERLHKVRVKPAFRRTSKKKSTNTEELIVAMRYTTYLSALVKEYNITVRRPAPLPAAVGSDSFTSPSVTLQGFRYSTEVGGPLPGDAAERRLHFRQGLVPSLLKHMAHCTHAVASAYGSEKFKAMVERFGDEYHAPQLFRTFTITTPGAQRGLTFRTHTDFHGAPWFDFLRCSVEERGESVDYAGRALAFVSLRSRYTGLEEMLVLVEWYVSCVDESGLGRGVRPRQDLRSCHPHLPFPAIKRQEAATKRWDLVDTDHVQGGLWVQQDFSDKDRFWVLTTNVV